MNNAFKDFALCVTETRKGDEIEIKCKLGLWSVTGRAADMIYHDALHYWGQYRDHGEYSDLIGGPTVSDKLIEALNNENP
jgi:hypothetical protein